MAVALDYHFKTTAYQKYEIKLSNDLLPTNRPIPPSNSTRAKRALRSILKLKDQNHDPAFWNLGGSEAGAKKRPREGDGRS